MYILYTPFDPQYMKILKWNDNSWKGKNIVIFLMSFQEGKKKKKKKNPIKTCLMVSAFWTNEITLYPH